MRKLKLFTHCILLATTPTLLVYPQHNVPQVSFQVVNQRPPLPTPQTVSWLGDWWWGSEEQEQQWVRPNTYDEIIVRHEVAQILVVAKQQPQILLCESTRRCV